MSVHMAHAPWHYFESEIMPQINIKGDPRHCIPLYGIVSNGALIGVIWALADNALRCEHKTKSIYICDVIKQNEFEVSLI